MRSLGQGTTFVATVLLVIACWGCGGGNSAAPTPQIADVAGSYSGTTTLAFRNSASQSPVPPPLQ
jgi:hypothetical protein